jgi:hypothetical protein
MCDYSLHSVRSRAAKAGDKLVIASFDYTSTRGFVALDKPKVAVCLRPGTELAFDKDVQWGLPLATFFWRKRASGKLVRFRQVNREWRDTHHDAIEFPNGQVVLLTSLRLGQKATVIQLPVLEYVTEHDRSDALVIDLVPMASDRSNRSEWFLL